MGIPSFDATARCKSRVCPDTGRVKFLRISHVHKQISGSSQKLCNVVNNTSNPPSLNNNSKSSGNDNRDKTFNPDNCTALVEEWNAIPRTIALKPPPLPAELPPLLPQWLSTRTRQLVAVPSPSTTVAAAAIALTSFAGFAVSLAWRQLVPAS